jgi:hypothetical protein
MKPIELTQKHRDKLLEMCKALFPEYEEILLEIEPQYDGSDGFVQLTRNLKNKFRFESIHWFEFCMTYLAEKLSQYPNQIEVDHPVDYLFEEFKKLKQ